MDYIRPAVNRGRANFGWLDSRHTFSFGHYYDPKHMGLSALRVINDDQVRGGAGFDTHGHRDMEIISYVLEGALEHKDSTGNQFTIPAGDVQLMSAGSGIMHSEFNASKTDPVHFLQIWIQPNVRGTEPGYQQARIEQKGPLTPLVTPDGRDGTLSMHQDASLSRLILEANEQLTLEVGERSGYLHIISGQAKVQAQTFAAGDGIGITKSRQISLQAGTDGLHALWFDLPTVS
ncbi:pirin family protein [Aliiglaciecola sp. CAU 1673]|uniref:pirin family protein n=1 Tax=Aliiglaciecola sp. CAU 1673 TaxID=3032595 RepID=UPI0023DC5CDE|nr:pirin family protein [Aliiglaciecola sp. CAU 1673]MDF2180114.1 pirin family protein [Aliiglaciecola sp. CAU 1673]